ncbi:MAG TPA: PH domain-containing protein [Pseudogracilibacillus sp.]|nr:PH domain-containing protein [Pseudogracilibacillus sp.]
MCKEQQYIEESEFSKPRRLHPAAMFFNLIRVIKETILGLGIGLIFTFKEASIFYVFIFVSIFAGFLIISSILSWLRFTYRVENNELRIEQGIFIRKKRFISINRIHKIDLTANIFHRLFQLVQVQIDTASSGGGAEVSLSAVKVAEAERLRKTLKKRQTTQTESEEQLEKVYPRKKITWGRLFIAGTTSGSVGIILAAILAGFTQIEELIPQNIYNSTFTWIINQGVILLIGLGIFMLLLLWLFGIAGTMIKYGNFTIEKRENELFIKRGLLETKELTIPFDRIQAIGIEQSLIRQPLKLVRVFAVVAGGSFDKMEPFPVLIPIIHEKEVEPFLQQFIPEYSELETDFVPLSKRGRKFYLLHASLLFVLLFFPVAYFIPTFSWIPLILIIGSLGFGWLQHKDGGYAIHGKKITLRKRGLGKVTIMTYHRRIQSLEKKQHKIQALQQLATTEVSLIGSGGLGTHYKLKHLEEEDANKIADWYSYRKPNDLLEQSE